MHLAQKSLGHFSKLLLQEGKRVVREAISSNKCGTINELRLQFDGGRLSVAFSNWNTTQGWRQLRVTHSTTSRAAVIVVLPIRLTDASNDVILRRLGLRPLTLSSPPPFRRCTPRGWSWPAASSRCEDLATTSLRWSPPCGPSSSGPSEKVPPLSPEAPSVLPPGPSASVDPIICLRPLLPPLTFSFPPSSVLVCLSLWMALLAHRVRF